MSTGAYILILSSETSPSLLFPIGSAQMVRKQVMGKPFWLSGFSFPQPSAQLAAPGWCWSLPRELRTTLTGRAPLGSHACPWPPSSPLSPSWGHLSCLFFIKRCLLNAYYVPGTALRAFGTPVRETDKHTSLASWSLCPKVPILLRGLVYLFLIF